MSVWEAIEEVKKNPGQGITESSSVKTYMVIAASIKMIPIQNFQFLRDTVLSSLFFGISLPPYPGNYNDI